MQMHLHTCMYNYYAMRLIQQSLIIKCLQLDRLHLIVMVVIQCLALLKDQTISLVGQIEYNIDIVGKAHRWT